MGKLLNCLICRLIEGSSTIAHANSFKKSAGKRIRFFFNRKFRRNLIHSPPNTYRIASPPAPVKARSLESCGGATFPARTQGPALYICCFYFPDERHMPKYHPSALHLYPNTRRRHSTSHPQTQKTSREQKESNQYIP